MVSAYNDRGQVAAVTSYDHPTNRDPDENVVNQIAYTYNDWGQVATSRQSHDGKVVSGTPTVTYAYDSLARLLSVTYPFDPEEGDPREVGYSYGGGVSTSMDYRLSRVTAITDDSFSGPDFAQYTYLGAGTIIKTSHPEVTGGLDLSLGSNDNAYSGLDRFGRVVDQVWQEAGENPDLFDEYLYGYDRAGPVQQLLPHAWKHRLAGCVKVRTSPAIARGRV